jgi:hypothetical protein
MWCTSWHSARVHRQINGSTLQRERRSFAFYGAVIAVSVVGRLLIAQNDRRPLQQSWQRGPLQLILRCSDEAPYVSDEVAVQLQVRAPAGTEIELPQLDGLPKEWQIGGVRRVGPDSEPDGDQVWNLSFEFDVLRAGSVELPPLAVRYRTSPDSDWASAETEAVSIEFRSMLGDDPDEAQPRPNPKPALWPAGRLIWIVLASVFLAVLVAALAGWVAWNRLPRRGTRPAPFSPYRKALEALLRLEAAGYLERGDVEPFYTELSGIIRHYIEDRFGLRAPEQTTEEFLQELTHRPVFVETQRRALETFLEQCDLVKFARVRPASPEGKVALSAARTFIEATRGDRAAVQA